MEMKGKKGNFIGQHSKDKKEKIEVVKQCTEEMTQ